MKILMDGFDIDNGSKKGEVEPAICMLWSNGVRLALEGGTMIQAQVLNGQGNAINNLFLQSAAIVKNLGLGKGWVLDDDLHRAFMNGSRVRLLDNGGLPLAVLLDALKVEAKVDQISYRKGMMVQVGPFHLLDP